MSDRPQPNKALELLSQFVPRDVLERAMELARQIQRDEYIRNYLERRSLIIGLVAVGATGGGFFLVFFLFDQVLLKFAPFAPWQRLALMLSAVVLWLGGVVVVMYWLFSRLQRGALAQRARTERSDGGRR
ncbi:MAG: hypothetical protein Q8K23_05815 [Sulfuritalea sp.]|nr:hypothetical protein [Sulfuritalea sp.]